MSKDAVILDALRTPIGKKDGVLAHWRPDDLAGEVMSALVKRNGVDPASVDDIVLGCVTQVQEQGFNIARNAALAGGFPVTVPADTPPGEDPVLDKALEVLGGAGVAPRPLLRAA